MLATSGAAGLHGLPIVFGITGHRDLPAESVPALSDSVRGIFERFRARYPATEFVLLTPLATGADRLAARVARTMDVSLRVPMPLEEREYRRDFDAAENAEFDALLPADSGHRYAMPFAPGNDAGNVGEPARRALQYRLVGRHIADLAHVLIALWNGKASDAVGGTAEIVDYRRFGDPSFPADPEALLDIPLTGTVYHVWTPRISDRAPGGTAGTLVVKTSGDDVLERDDPNCALYGKIERFNRDRETLLGDAAASLRADAESLATHYQRRYVRTLDRLFAAATAGAVALALTSIAAPAWLSVTLYAAYAAFFAAGYVASVVAQRGQWKDRSIEYRALEIGLTIQDLWDLAGVRASAAECYLRIQRGECDWIRRAVHVVHHFVPGAARDERRGAEAIRDFIAGQITFFSKAARRDRGRSERYEGLTRASFVATAIFAVSLLTIGAANLAPHAAPLDGPLASGADWCIRGIIVTTIFAAVFHEYARRRAFEAQARRYDAMLPIYRRAMSLLDGLRDAPAFEDRIARSQEVARAIGREALAENSEWLLMHRDLPIETVHV